MKWLYPIVLVPATVMFTACASIGNAPSGMATQEVERAYGKPYRVWPESAGGTSWEYPTGPEGKLTYMARMDPRQRVTRVDQVLSDDWFAKVQRGMSEREVEHLLGRPYSRAEFPRMQQTVWAWRYQNTIWDRCFYVHFDPQGKVVNTSSRDEDKDPIAPGFRPRPC